MSELAVSLSMVMRGGGQILGSGESKPQGQVTSRSLDEVEDAIDGLTEQDLAALIAKAEALSFGTGVEGADLLNEAILAALEEQRSWPSHITFEVFLVMSVKSIAWNKRRKANRTVPVDMSFDGHSVQEAQQRFLLPAEEEQVAALRCKMLVEQLLDLFKDDQQALALILGRVDGLTVEEICDLGNIEPDAYQTVSKRVQRKLAKAIGTGAIQ